MDVALKHARAYTLARRACLALSVLLTFGLPLWHLWSLERPTPGVVGPVGAVRLWGLELIDPLAMVSVLLSQGPTWLWLATTLPAVALVAVLGRFFCGWVCPYVPLLAVSNASRWWLRRLGFQPWDWRLPKRSSYVLLVAVLAAGTLFGLQLWPLLYPPSVIGRQAFHAVFFGGLGAGSALIAFAFCFDTFVSRAGFCRSICPGGAVYSLVGAASPLVLKLDAKKCTLCTACDVVCNLGQQPMSARLDEGCERCGKCVAACPTDALRWGLKR